jgi:hypothetical protein
MMIEPELKAEIGLEQHEHTRNIQLMVSRLCSFINDQHEQLQSAAGMITRLAASSGDNGLVEQAVEFVEKMCGRPAVQKQADMTHKPACDGEATHNEAAVEDGPFAAVLGMAKEKV